MAKMSGITGKLQGKYGNAVFRVRRGVQVMAQYNPTVENPNTDKQIQARAKWKLVSQLASVFAKIIAIPRDGGKTPRNIFTQVNYSLLNFNGDRAQIDLPYVQLTKSSRAMAPFIVTRSNGQAINVALQNAELFSRVVYVVVAKNLREELNIFASETVENPTPNEANIFSASLPYTSQAIVVYAYAMTDANSQVSLDFQNLVAPTAQEVASLLVRRGSDIYSYNLTKTSGAYLEVGTDDAVSVEGERTNGAPESVTIGGFTPFAEYTDVVLACSTNGASIFYTVDGSTPTAQSTPYSNAIRITETTTIKAVAILDGMSSPVTTKTLTKSNSGQVQVVAPVISGTSPFTSETTVTITAENGARIFYTRDGSNPTEESTVYEEPFMVKATTTVKAVAMLQGTLSPVASRTFTLDNGGTTE